MPSKERPLRQKAVVCLNESGVPFVNGLPYRSILLLLMDSTSKKAIQVAILGTLGCGAIIGLAALAVIWISAEHEAEPAVAAETPVKPDQSDLKSSNEAGSGVSSAPQPEEPHNDGGPIHDATDDDVNGRFNALGYGLGGAMPPWMPKYPQVSSPKKLWSSVLSNQSLEEGAQVILCNIHLNSICDRLTVRQIRSCASCIKKKNLFTGKSGHIMRHFGLSKWVWFG